MKITTGGKELLDTETFLTIGVGETVVTLDDLRFLLDFADNTKEKGTILRAQTVDDKTLRLTLTNWSNVLGSTLLEPMEIGFYKNRKLFVLLHIAKAGREGEQRLVTFSLYLGEKV